MMTQINDSKTKRFHNPNTGLNLNVFCIFVAELAQVLLEGRRDLLLS